VLPIEDLKQEREMIRGQWGEGSKQWIGWAYGIRNLEEYTENGSETLRPHGRVAHRIEVVKCFPSNGRKWGLNGRWAD
jgi:hypothetical protein